MATPGGIDTSRSPGVFLQSLHQLELGVRGHLVAGRQARAGGGGLAPPVLAREQT